MQHKDNLRSLVMILAIAMAIMSTMGCVTPPPCADPVTPTPEATAKATTEVTPTATADVTKMISYNEDDIAKAKLVAEQYYQDKTNFVIESIEHDKMYNEVNAMRFKAVIKDSDNPPRTITIVREDQDSPWVAKEGSEGY